ncbi:hypothetical protein [Eoetvoesiella caeni]
MSHENLINAYSRSARKRPASMADRRCLELCVEQLTEGAKLVIVVLDELIAEHGDLPISDALVDRLIESVGLLDRAQSALASARGESSNHVRKKYFAEAPGTGGANRHQAAVEDGGLAGTTPLGV